MALFANMGLPMICIGLPYMAMLLAPVVLIEAAWYRRFLRVPWPQAWRGSLRANLQSTFLGLPLAWLVWTFAWVGGVSLAKRAGLITQEQFLFSYAAGFLELLATSGWLLPTRGPVSEVLLLGAGLVLLLPAYLVSYLWEARLLRREWPGLAAAEVRCQVWRAHLLTYGLLYAAAGIRFYCVGWLDT